MQKFLFIVLAGLLSACGGSQDDEAGAGEGATTGNSQTDADVADIKDYRLTMDRMDKFFQAQMNVALAAKQMSPEQREAMEMEESSADATLEEMTDRIEKNPPFRDAIRKAGLSPREYVTLSLAYVTSAMAAGVLQMRPNDNQDSLARAMDANLENIRFLQENRAELEKKQKAFEAEAKRLGLTED